MEKRFNIRVYGIWLNDGRVLVNEEMIKGRKVIKFPGGGIEMGEGTIGCLKREWMEELGLEIAVLDHFYTTDFYQASAFDNSQVISIYYWVFAAPDAIITNHIAGERTYWMDITDIHEGAFTLPIDKKVAGMLNTLFNKSHS